MSDMNPSVSPVQPVDLIRRLPHLYHALEGAIMVGASSELPSDYERELRRLANDAYDAIIESINGADLTDTDRKRAVLALETLRQSPAKRARINAAGRVLMEVPRGPEAAGALAARRLDDVQANMNASAECIHREAEATRTLVDLLHTLIA